MLTDTEIILPEVNRFGLYTGVICVDFRDVIQVQFILTGVRVQHRRGRFFLENPCFPLAASMTLLWPCSWIPWPRAESVFLARADRDPV